MEVVKWKFVCIFFFCLLIRLSFCWPPFFPLAMAQNTVSASLLSLFCFLTCVFLVVFLLLFYLAK